MALFVTVVPASAGEPDVGASVCVVVGTVDVNPGVGSVPIGGASAGTYDFDQVALICVGVQAGVGTADSNGSTGTACGTPHADMIFGSFCGTYTANGFASGAVNGNGNCRGPIGGNQAGINQPTLPPPLNLLPGPPVSGLGDDWSLTFGPVILGSIGADCTPATTPNAGAPGTMNDGRGLFAAVAEPMPTSLATTLTGGACSAPPGALPPPVPGPVLWFCQILIEGVAVIVDTVDRP